jgi:hypothetical protein
MKTLLRLCGLLALCLAALWLQACLVTRADCDQNNRCEEGQRCFRSRSTTASGYCWDACEAPEDCTRSYWTCGPCSDNGQALCLDGGDGSVCRPCTCDPRCPDSARCVEGVCVEGATECACRGQSFCDGALCPCPEGQLCFDHTCVDPPPSAQSDAGGGEDASVSEPSP